ncbi:kinase-like protein, partial [Martensiomyces pterosporus]
MVPPVKVIPALYDVAQPRTPHPLSPADSLKTPGYIDPESLPFELGSTITDSGTAKQYKLLSVLGEGSYAVVYLARCSRDGAKYALKCLSKLGLTARQLSLQRSELEIHSSVCPHPHIVTLYSHFETRDWLFLVMERVSGPDLYDYITQHPAFNANQEERRFVEATRLFEQMIDAVAHIHALKAYHRDLKPENFILGADGNLKLTDFGLATREPLSTDFECGSKPYMSYENRNGGLNPNDPTVYGPRDDYSPRLSDVWALGVLFLNLLFAQSPWTDPS